jgi:hypothetical protein
MALTPRVTVAPWALQTLHRPVRPGCNVMLRRLRGACLVCKRSAHLGVLCASHTVKFARGPAEHGCCSFMAHAIRVGRVVGGSKIAGRRRLIQSHEVGCKRTGRCGRGPLEPKRRQRAGAAQAGMAPGAAAACVPLCCARALAGGSARHTRTVGRALCSTGRPSRGGAGVRSLRPVLAPVGMPHR